jgi:hypothetical protein
MRAKQTLRMKYYYYFSISSQYMNVSRIKNHMDLIRKHMTDIDEFS